MADRTQLRARRTRLRILKALHEVGGEAGFTQIKNLTALSTGSIYYNIERMEGLVTKKNKKYQLTTAGRDLVKGAGAGGPWVLKSDQSSPRESAHDASPRVSLAG